MAGANQNFFHLTGDTVVNTMVFIISFEKILAMQCNVFHRDRIIGENLIQRCKWPPHKLTEKTNFQILTG